MHSLVAIESFVSSSCVGNAAALLATVAVVEGGMESLVFESLVFESSSSAGLGAAAAEALVPLLLLVTFSLLATLSAESELLSPSPCNVQEILSNC